MALPPHLLQHRTHYRTLGRDRDLVLLGAGFMCKPGIAVDVENYFASHYSAVYVLRGRGTYTDENGAAHDLTPGTVFQRQPDRRHSLRLAPESDWAECFLAFGRELYEALGPYQLPPADIPVWRPGLRPDLVRDIHELGGRLTRTPDRELAGLLPPLLTLLWHLWEEHQRRAGQAPRTGLLDQACRRLAGNLPGRQALPTLLTGLGVSYERLRKLFQEELGLTPGQYRIRCRIDAACGLLSDRQLSIKEVSRRLGYPNPYAFSTQFRDTMGLTPSAFRRGTRG